MNDIFNWTVITTLLVYTGSKMNWSKLSKRINNFLEKENVQEIVGFGGFFLMQWGIVICLDGFKYLMVN